eukprot:TRINITY_DN3779_c0_g1_i1.p1 TRINITY_DN3779_c0_g1~~TRINITY_DN3779_c0_g1_i1.p1  ORF type:complete len:183 (+),score=41.87 TRINITY_DN3779_c0_g1_i1:524-1072(+)
MQKFVLAFALFIGCIFGYAAGPGDCVSPKAPMAAAPAAGTDGGFLLDGVPAVYELGTNYTIKIYSQNAMRFAGFILYAESNADAGVRVGTFGPTDYTDTVTLCDTYGAGSTIGHNNIFRLNNGSVATVFWISPSENQGSVSFKGVVVRSYQTWYNLSPVSVEGSASALIIPVVVLFVLALLF